MGLSKLFGDVRAGEGRSVALLTLNLFISLFCYYLIKTVREPLILATGGAELKTYASAVQAVTLIGAVPAYDWLTGRYPREKSIRLLLLFFIGCIQVFFVLGQFKVPMLGFVFYVWVGIFSLVLIAQFWSFANDLMSPEQGKRLFPIIGIGAALGSWLGAAAAGALFDAGVNAFTLMQVAAAMLLVHLVLYKLSGTGTGSLPTHKVGSSGDSQGRDSQGRDSQGRDSQGRDSQGRDNDAKKSAQQTADVAMAGSGGFALLLSNRYLTLIAVLLLVLNIVNTLGEYILSDAIRSAAEAAFAAQGSGDQAEFMKRYIGGAYGSFFAVVNALTFVLQAFFASRLVKWGGLRAVLIALPLVALCTYTLSALGVGLVIFRWAKTAENGTDYSLMNTAKAMLWLPTTRQEKYRAKQAVDTVFVRIGDVLAALVVFVGLRAGFDSQHFSIINLIAIGLWLGLCVVLARRYEALAA